jgi:hypothetical protein
MFSRRLTSALELFVLLVLADALVRTLWTTRSLAGAYAHLAPALAVAADRPGGQRPRRVPHRLYVCYRNLKSWDAFNAPHDEDLLRFEKWLFLGHSPAHLLHQLIGHDTTAYVLMLVYRSFHVPRPVVGGRRTGRHRPDPRRLRVPHLRHVGLDPGRRLLLPDPVAGTVRQRAPGLHVPSHQLDHAHADGLLRASGRTLLEQPWAPDAFASISAFASLHVAFSCLILLTLRAHGRYRLAWVMTAYVGATMVATIYFGWHFVVDDVAAC